MSPEWKRPTRDHLKVLRDRAVKALGDLLFPTEEPPRSPFAPETYPIDIGGFYAAYEEVRIKQVSAARQDGIEPVENIDYAAALSLHAATRAAYMRERHGLFYGPGFAYPEIKAQRQADPNNFVDASEVTLDPATRDLALECTQAWIVHGSKTNPGKFEDLYMLDSFQHLGCSLTIDCLPAGITFEDLGIQPTKEISSMSPATAMIYLGVQPDILHRTSIVENVRQAFAQRVATW